MGKKNYNQIVCFFIFTVYIFVLLLLHRSVVSNNPKSTQRPSTQKAEGRSGVLAQVAISKRVKCKLMLDDC